MASKAALLLAFNILFFTVVSSTYVPFPPTKPETPKGPKYPPVVPKPPSQKYPTCPRDTLKLGVCADVLGLVHVVVGKPPKTPCCSLLEGLVDLEAAVCLCTALKAGVLGTDLNIPVDLSLILNYCGKGVPKGFQCA